MWLVNHYRDYKYFLNSIFRTNNPSRFSWDMNCKMDSGALQSLSFSTFSKLAALPKQNPDNNKNHNCT
jgi:hypothetical protein